MPEALRLVRNNGLYVGLVREETADCLNFALPPRFARQLERYTRLSGGHRSCRKRSSTYVAAFEVSYSLDSCIERGVKRGELQYVLYEQVYGVRGAA